MLDWSKLKPYKTSKEKSFEQLCFQIARRNYGKDGIFTPIDDSGGGDGVEFYMSLPSGEQWGWQTKFYEGNVRLRDSGRKAAIKESLKKTLAVHPDLTKWFLCLPLDPTTDETIWINNELPKIIPAGRIVQIISWTHTSIHDQVNRPGFEGIWHAFFNVLELNEQWFANAFKNSFTLVKNKFDELLYVPNSEFEYYQLNPALCNDLFRKRLDFYLPLLHQLFDESIEHFNDLNFTTEQFRPFFEVYQKKMTVFNGLFLDMQPFLEARYTQVRPNTMSKLSPADLEPEVESLQAIINEAKEEFRIAVAKGVGKENEEQERLNLRQHQKIWDHEGKCKKLVEEIKYFIRDTCIPHKRQISHFVGDGGTGKTNLCVAISKSHIDAKLPVIFLPAVKFNDSNPLQEQVLNILDIKTGYSFSEFADTLNSLGVVYNIKVPIVIDGLNEAINSRGALNQVLQRDLPMLEEEIKSRSNLVLITTCRSSYQDFFWPGTRHHEDNRFHPLYGFTNYEDVKSLVQHYFEVYKIQADYSFNSLQQFSKPIYVKLYCETVNPERKRMKQVTLGYHSIYTIFEKYTLLADAHIYKRLTTFGRAPLDKYKRLASDVTAVLAGELWKNPRRALSIEEVLAIADPDGIIDFNQSVTKAVLDEELLFMRDYSLENENVYLTYDLMSGYFIAKYLVVNYPDVESFLKSAEIEKLTTHKHLALHPVYEDVLKALCTLLPILKDIFIHDIVGRPARGDERGIRLFNESITCSLTLPPEYLPKNQIDMVRELIEVQGNFIRILKVCEPVLFVADHPFNFDLFDEYLAQQSMGQRDVVWTEYIRNQDNNFRAEIIAEFKKLNELDDHSPEQQQKIKLAGRYLFWNFTSTNKALKQEVADTLFEFGKKYTEDFFLLYEKAITTNDPSMFEWMSVVGYNLVLHLLRFNKSEKPLLKRIAELLSSHIFDTKGYYSTNHLTIRDYAFRTLEHILNDKEAAEKLKLQFQELGVREWQVTEDKNKDDYREGNSLIHYRFEKDRMHLVGGGGNEYNHTPLYDERLGNLRWRAYQLGYEFELFGEIDKTIARMQGYGGSFMDTQRYADKYIEIAYQELLGYLEDRKLVNSLRDGGPLRIETPKFEPKQTQVNLNTERIIKEDHVNAGGPLKQWCNDHKLPEVVQYLHREEFKNVKGDWQLLYGFFHQCKPEAERQLFCYMEGILLRKKDFSRALKDFPLATNLGSNNTPYSTNVHDAEIPDGKIIPFNQFHEWYYTMEKKTGGRNVHGNGKTIDIIYPVRIIDENVYPSKNIIDHLAIERSGESKNLYDSAGTIASLSHRFEHSYVDQESFCYIQKRLLDKFLTDNNLEMLYIVWGERDWYPPDGDWGMAGRKAQEREWAKFCEIIPYKRS
jgi:hypothetical protein